MDQKGMAGAAMFAALSLIVVNLGMYYLNAFGGGHADDEHEKNVADLVKKIEGDDKGDRLLQRVLGNQAAAGKKNAIRARFQQRKEREKLMEAIRKAYLNNYDEVTARAAKRFFESSAGKRTLEARKEADANVRAWIDQSE